MAKNDSSQQKQVKVDLRYPEFLKDLVALTPMQQAEVMSSIYKIQQMTWQELWNQSTKGQGKTGFNYEFIMEHPKLGKVHSIRISGGFRARVVRAEEWMRFISLHPDHDSAYKR